MNYILPLIIGIIPLILALGIAKSLDLSEKHPTITWAIGLAYCSLGVTLLRICIPIVLMEELFSGENSLFNFMNITGWIIEGCFIGSLFFSWLGIRFTK